MKVIEKFLDEGQYLKGTMNPDSICLHHTVSNSAVGDITYWNTTPDRVGTHYLIAKDGTVYQAIPLETGWAYHLGAGIPSINNKNTIGIELVNEGGLLKKDDGNYYWNGTNLYKYPENVLELRETWRGYKYFPKYTTEQYVALNELISFLRIKFPKIGTKLVTHLNLDMNVLKEPCIFCHYHVKDTKSDVSPAFEFEKISIVK